MTSPNKPYKWLAISSQFTATVIGFVLLGYFLDDYFEVKKKYITLTATLLGVVVGFYFLYKSIKNLQ